ncbi:MAG: hypothetical protein II870_07100 [Synergistaceae bacterium]|nr:hypothetical protein [Synergistaceae bacterium]
MGNTFCTALCSPSRAWTDEEKLKLLQLKHTGHSFYELANRFNVPPYEIREALEDITQQIAFNQPPRSYYKYREGYHHSDFASKSSRCALGRALEAIFSY